MTEAQFDLVTRWQEETFPSANALSKIHHLYQEVEELEYDLVNNKKDRRLEYADCILLLFGSAFADGMSYDDIIGCIDEKMEINKNREWGIPDKNGVVNHVK